MYRPLALYIGLRYTRAKRDKNLISLTSWVSMLGIALGVMVVITILSVLNGFDREIKKQVFSMIPPITISSDTGQINHWQSLEKITSLSPDIIAAAPFASGQALLSNANVTQSAIVTGILPEKEKQVSALANKMVQGNFFALMPNRFGIILGEALAKRLQVKVGDPLIVAIPQGSFSLTHISPRLKKFTVVGIFQAGGGEFAFDTRFAFIHLHDAQQLFSLGSSVTALHVNIHHLYAAPKIAELIQAQLSPDERAGNWTEQLGDFFENIRMTKTMMLFIFVLIIGVAVFNLISTMIMFVQNKQSDIAILRTFGATPKMILAIFVAQGAAIGISGTLLGITLGLALTWNISAISHWLQTFFHVQLISSNVYFVNYLPAELQWHDVGLISLIAIILSLIATLYPAWNAARTEPADALRYE